MFAERLVEESFYRREHITDPLGQKPFMEEVKPTEFKEGELREIPFEEREKTRLVVEKQSKEGPLEDPRGYFHLDDQRKYRAQR